MHLSTFMIMVTCIHIFIGLRFLVRSRLVSSLVDLIGLFFPSLGKTDFGGGGMGTVFFSYCFVVGFWGEYLFRISSTVACVCWACFAT